MFGVTRMVGTAAAGLALPFLLGTAMTRAQQKPTVEEPTIDMQWAVKIPARDGVKLNATVFTPHGQKGPLPVIFTFTPYIGDSYTDRAMYFAKHGYVYALVDVWGRGNSAGEFEPFVNEGRDGYDDYNSGGVVAAETGKDAKTGHIKLMHDDMEYASALELPIVEP